MKRTLDIFKQENGGKWEKVRRGLDSTDAGWAAIKAMQAGSKKNVRYCMASPVSDNDLIALQKSRVFEPDL